MEKRKKGHGCLWASLIMILLMSLACGFLVLGLATTGRSLHMPVALRQMGADESPELNEIWSFGSGGLKAVVVPIRGMITLSSSSHPLSAVAGSSVLALRSIRRATHDKEVRAIILDIDSGGGGITASDILYKSLLDFKAQSGDRVVVAVFGDVAASGAYYLALAADRIMARPTTVTGSIGVLMQTINVKQLGEKIGVRDVTIKSGANKDMLNPFGDLSVEQRGMLQGIVDGLHARFVSLVVKERGLMEEQVRAMADGRVFLASEALDLGLLDDIGYWDDALELTAELLGVDGVRVYRYEKEFSFSDLVRAASSLDLRSVFEGSGGPRFLYRWEP